MKKMMVVSLVVAIAAFTIITSQKASSNEKGKSVCSGISIESIQKHVPIPNGNIESMKEENGLCEIIFNIGGQYVPIYANEKFVVAGEMYQFKKQITEERIGALKAEVIKKNIDGLNQATAITYKPKGAGERSLYMITDPLCPYCNTAASNIKTIMDNNKVTLKTILYTVHGEEGTKKINTAICKKFSFDQYADGKWKTEKNESAECKDSEALNKKASEIAQKIGITGVPAFIFEDGQIVSGANLIKINEILQKQKDTLLSKK